MLILEDLTRRYGDRRAVERVSLAIPRGRFVGVIGRSGAGKSTLLRMINRLAEPTGGRILFDGLDVTALGRLSEVPRHRALLKLWSERERALALAALDGFGMGDFAGHRADQLSGGQQQRVAIARAMMQAPDLILADEPVASLDPRNTRIVMDALAEANRRHGITVLCNLHSLDLARGYCDRLIGLADGRLVFDGAPAELTEDVARRLYGLEAGEVLDAPAPAPVFKAYPTALVA
jgi:phosphonate transport system ATP-binding protein